MEEFWILILVAFFATNSLEKAESVKLELKTFDEIFGEGWWEKGEAEELKTPAPKNFGQNVHHQIDRQNTQIGQIEPNSIDQLGQIEPNSTDQSPHSGQIEPNSTDQNPPLTESYHSDNTKNNKTVAKELGFNFVTIYNWKRELGQTTPNKYPHSEQKELMKRYYEIKGQTPKISDEEIAKKILKIGSATLNRWKKQFKRQQFHPNSVDGHSVEENAAANIQEIANSNSGNI
uniref:Transposase n=1 Tax=Globodera rostochiensis TaxID=31243 RepID=A0A914HS00_GLORO